jgi:hypothetical protein
MKKRKMKWKKFREEGIIITNNDVRTMIKEATAAEELCRLIPGFDLATSGLVQELRALQLIACARELSFEDIYPDKEKLIEGIYKKVENKDEQKV